MMEISKEKKEKKKRIVPIWVCILIFIGAFFAGMISKVAIKPAWSTKYTATWSEELGTKITDISYGDGEANKFDLYLPKDSTKDTYGLVIYLHAGGFTSGDKTDDENMLAWLCSKGYVAAGINYTLRTDTNNASVLLQSNEIKEAIPIVVEEAKNRGYNIDKMTVSGGSAGHALAMIYAYRDAQDAPVPVVFTFGAVGPSCFYVEDWGVYPIPTVVEYGTCDKVQPFLASLRLKEALEDNGVDYKYYELPHSGHGLQNDDRISEQWMESIDEYLNKYMPVN